MLRTWNVIVVQTFMKLSSVYCASFPHHNNAVIHCCIIYCSATLIVFSVFIGKHSIWDNYSLQSWSAIWFMSTSENYPNCLQKAFSWKRKILCFWFCFFVCFIFKIFLFSFSLSFSVPKTFDGCSRAGWCL